MDIFSTKQRTKNDALEDPPKLKGSTEDEKWQNIVKTHQQQIQLFNKFLENQFVKNEKTYIQCINKCNSIIENQGEFQVCQQNCNEKYNNLSKIVDFNIDTMESLLNNCIHNAQILPNSEYESLYCHQLYNKGFSTLKKLIIEQNIGNQ